MRALASFVTSDAGRLYGVICERWGLDPGAPLERVDDVMAFNLRAGLARVLWQSEPEMEAQRHDELVQRARAAVND